MGKQEQIFDNHKDIDFMTDFRENKLTFQQLGQRWSVTADYAEKRIHFIQQLNSSI